MIQNWNVERVYVGSVKINCVSLITKIKKSVLLGRQRDRQQLGSPFVLEEYYLSTDKGTLRTSCKASVDQVPTKQPRQRLPLSRGAQFAHAL